MKLVIREINLNGNHIDHQLNPIECVPYVRKGQLVLSTYFNRDDYCAAVSGAIPATLLGDDYDITNSVDIILPAHGYKIMLS